MDQVRIITLTTDFGTRDGYVGVMKGVILRINPQVQLVDLTHEIAPQDIWEAAFVLAASYRYFPPGTVHLVVVDPGVGGERKPIVVEAGDWLFVGPDNGVFGLVYRQERAHRVVEIANPRFLLPELSHTFHGRDLFAPVAGHLSLGVDIAQFGPELKGYQQIDFPEPRVGGKRIEAEIIHVDRFGNLITNLSLEFLGKLEGRVLKIVAGDWMISGLSRSYAEVKPGELLAIFDSSDLLEIAENLGNAKKRLGLDRGDTIEVIIGS